MFLFRKVSNKPLRPVSVKMFMLRDRKCGRKSFNFQPSKMELVLVTIIQVIITKMTISAKLVQTDLSLETVFVDPSYEYQRAESQVNLEMLTLNT